MGTGLSAEPGATSKGAESSEGRFTAKLKTCDLSLQPALLKASHIPSIPLSIGKETLRYRNRRFGNRLILENNIVLGERESPDIDGIELCVKHLFPFERRCQGFYRGARLVLRPG